MNAMPYTSHAPLIVKLTKRNILTKDPLDNQVLSYNIVINTTRKRNIIKGKKVPPIMLSAILQLRYLVIK